MDHEQIIENLLNEYNDHREAIKSMIVDLEKIRVKVDTILPETLDKRFRFFFEEKIKSITSLFGTLLDMRKEISKSVKDEIEVRRKISKESGGDGNFEDLLDIRKIASRVESLRERSEKIKKIAVNE